LSKEPLNEITVSVVAVVRAATMAMELQLHRIDLLQTSAASPGTLVVSIRIPRGAATWCKAAP
jgi:hypothetical protein